MVSAGETAISLHIRIEFTAGPLICVCVDGILGHLTQNPKSEQFSFLVCVCGGGGVGSNLDFLTQIDPTLASYCTHSS